jgi:hypothetical protein
MAMSLTLREAHMQVDCTYVCIPMCVCVCMCVCVSVEIYPLAFHITHSKMQSPCNGPCTVTPHLVFFYLQHRSHCFLFLPLTIPPIIHSTPAILAPFLFFICNIYQYLKTFTLFPFVWCALSDNIYHTFSLIFFRYFSFKYLPPHPIDLHSDFT